MKNITISQKYCKISIKQNYKAVALKLVQSIQKNVLLPSLLFTLFIFFIFTIQSQLAFAVPEGPTITLLGNQTNTPDVASIINTTGGSITTVFLNATTQNIRWKAYVGNVTGKMTLDDAAGQTIYNWPVSIPSGVIHATRKSTTVSWTDIQCANLTHIENENNAINQSLSEDNITTTFATKLHRTFYVGTTEINNNTCYSVHTYSNSTAQSSFFDEVALYDGTNVTNGNLVYSTMIENNIRGYNNQTYDFQMIIPENGLPTWSSSIAYYFYVELT